MQRQAKTASEQKKVSKNGYRYKVGTVDRKTNKTCYVSLGCWITTDTSLRLGIDRIRRRLRHRNANLISEVFKGKIVKHMSDIDYAETKHRGVADMTTFMNVEITLFGDLEWYNDEFQATLSQYVEKLYLMIESCDSLIITPDKK